MEHYGVYGAWQQNGLSVAIRKARGPYIGMLDLPGGSPNPGESSFETLTRELHEECGVTRFQVLSWHPFEFQIDKSSTGETIDFHHKGIIALINAQDAVSYVEDIEDVRGVELIDPARHSEMEFTPAFSYALSLLPKHTE